MKNFLPESKRVFITVKLDNNDRCSLNFAGRGCFHEGENANLQYEARDARGQFESIMR